MFVVMAECAAGDLAAARPKGGVIAGCPTVIAYADDCVPRTLKEVPM